MFVFTNLSDEQLNRLIDDANDERKRRWLKKNIELMPKPVLLESKVESVKMYRCEHGTTLWEAMQVIGHYWEKRDGNHVPSVPC